MKRATHRTLALGSRASCNSGRRSRAAWRASASLAARKTFARSMGEPAGSCVRSSSVSTSATTASMSRATETSMSASRACFDARSNARSVQEIEHSLIDRAFFSCDQIRLRVQSDLKFGCSISLINKRRSITELNPDSRQQHFFVKHPRRLAVRTLRFCGSAPSEIRPALAAPSTRSSAHRSLLRAGPPPSFPADALSARARAGVSSSARGATLLSPSSPRRIFAGRCHAHAAFPMGRSLRRPAFISVSGFRPDRSALHSDLRLKRFSGSAAATVHPHAPMNSPAASGAGFPSQPSAS